MFSNLFHYIQYQMRIRSKLLLSFALFLVLPLVIFSQISYQRVSKTLNQESQDAAAQLLSQTAMFLEYKSAAISYASDQIYYNSDFRRDLRLARDVTISPASFETYLSVRNTLKQTFSRDEMSSMTLYLENWPYLTSPRSERPETINFADLQVLTDEQTLYDRLLSSGGKLLWLPASENPFSSTPKEPVISAIRLIRSDADYSESVAVLRIDQLQEDFRQIVQKSCLNADCRSYLFDASGVCLLSNTASSDYGIPAEYLENAAVGELQWTNASFDGVPVLLGTIRLSQPDWVLLTQIPYAAILESSIRTRNQMLLLAVLICLLAIPAACWMANAITGRLSALSKEVAGVSFEEQQLPAAEQGSDEISELARSYHYLLARLQAYSAQQFESGKMVKQAELRALRAQINPHFLYNTLDLMNWMAISRKAPEISEVAVALSKFYKLSLNKGREFITIRDELTHVRLYVMLQNYRFHNTILLRTHVPPSMEELLMPNLILQPIVENAILHGIAEKNPPSGTVQIFATQENEYIVLRVVDDGVGMPKELCSTIFQPAQPDTGYGLFSVNERLQLLYGAECGLQFESEPGKGTSVTIRMKTHTQP